MKSLPIYSSSFNAVLQDFEKELAVWNYSITTSYYMTIHLREFFHYLETKGYEHIKYITTKIVSQYYEHLSSRKNVTQNGALSNATLNKHQQALKLFKKYLKRHESLNFGVHLKTEKQNSLTLKDILSVDEVKQLFEACECSHKSKRYRLRDKAMLTLMYGCGLRTHQVVGLDLKDIDFQTGRLNITSGAQNKKRNHTKQVLLANQLKALEDYIYFSRPHFYNAKYCDALFVNKNGTRMQGKAHRNRLDVILKTTENKDIIAKKISCHNLRHSIATHLLVNGMTIQQVSQFLGHSSLESTQIYVHLAELLNAE
ncbi:tyrosine-type recombinase/integrase [Psychroserpens luteus]|uniref:Tyrosine-type recombinase/integrase n=1 Tax=Psychroserpens luteus TaxID=1434066 RepID=A0ABW5ZWT7_9FLAO|nr:tyrosine-type recombinase/integrase [Psychroserpens luteus]